MGSRRPVTGLRPTESGFDALLEPPLAKKLDMELMVGNSGDGGRRDRKKKKKKKAGAGLKSVHCTALASRTEYRKRTKIDQLILPESLCPRFPR